MSTSKMFDPLFAKYAGGIPIAYLRSLAKRESNMNPRESRDPAWGLMQIVPVVRKSYNERFGTAYTKQDLLNPEINVRLATETLQRIISNYSRFHPKTLKPNWGDPNWVSLLTAGWNSGYSEKAGVGKVAKFLEAKGIPVTHKNVFAYAGKAGATRHLQTAQRESWQKSVTNLYFQQPDRPSFPAVAAVAIAAAAALAWWRLAR